MDDDGDCAEHVWVVDQLHLHSAGADEARHCARCGAVTYDGGTGQAATRLEVDGGVEGT